MITDEMVKKAAQAIKEYGAKTLLWRETRTDQARAALEAVAPMLAPQWQDISTAPRDGTWFLGFQTTPGDYENRIAICRWGEWRNTDGITGGLFIAPNGLMPTHWMPLPAGPEDVG